MIYENWFGVFSKKGELLAVEETETQAKANALFAEDFPSYPTNKTGPVTIVSVPLESLILSVIDLAKLKLSEKKARELSEKITENLRNFEEMKKTGLWTGKDL